MNMLAVLAAVGLGGIMMLGIQVYMLIPESDVACYAGAKAPEDRGSYVWTQTAPVHQERVLHVDIPSDVIERSMESKGIRWETVAYHGTVLADQDDPYVQIVAGHIQSVTRGCSPGVKAQAALDFVSSVISYGYDTETYGTPERWQAPVETLYYRVGDCEDSATLYVSIVRAMGLDQVLVHIPGHISAAVAVGDTEGTVVTVGDTAYTVCEPTRPHARLGVSSKDYTDADIVPEQVTLSKGFLDALNAYRNLIAHVIGV